MSAIAQVFRALRKKCRKALIPYLMAGFPSLEDTKRYIIDLEEAGADIIELGIPFSDPLADGPTIQRASEEALRGGVTLRKVLEFVKEVREESKIPLVLMTYYNPVFKYGDEKFITDAVQAGVNGVIIPDLIPDEAGEFKRIAKKSSLDTIFLLAPTSTEERIKKVVQASSGFIYYVSITGTTGAQLTVDKAMKDTLSRIQSMTGKPIAVGFGISSPEEAAAVSKLADGVIIGSALVKLIAQGKDISDFVRGLREAI